MNVDSPTDDPSDGRWMTFGELAVSRGIDKLSAARLVRRHRWRRQRDNSGRVMVLVPPEWQRVIADGPKDNPSDSLPDISPTIRALQAAYAAAVEAKDAEIAALRGQVALIDGFVQRADRAEASLAAERSRADRTEQAAAAERARADGLRDRLNSMQEQLADAHGALQMAESAEARAVRAEASRDAERSRADALRERLDDATAELHAAQEAAGEALALVQQAERARRGRGRWARLRAAWRGE